MLDTLPGYGGPSGGDIRSMPHSAAESVEATVGRCGPAADSNQETLI